MPPLHNHDPLRVLFLLGDLEMGGAQRVMLTVLRHLDWRRLDPHLAVVRGGGPLEEEIPEGLHIHRLRSGKVRYAFLPLLRLCRSLDPHWVVSTVGHLNLLLLLTKPFLPRHTALIIREANTPSIRLNHTRYPMLYRTAYRMLYPLSDKVICSCNYMRDDLIQHFSISPAKIEIIPNPVDLERLRHGINAGGNPYPDDRTQIVSVGRLNYQKGFDLLIMAFSLSLKKNPNIRLTIVGDGPERAALKELAEDLGISEAVAFAGEVKNPFPYMAHADFLVLSSRWEGSPNTVLESLGCGTPVLAFESPGGTAEIIKEGENGWLVPSLNWKELARRMVWIVEEKGWSRLEGKSLLPERHLCGNVGRLWEAALCA